MTGGRQPHSCARICIAVALTFSLVVAATVSADTARADETAPDELVVMSYNLYLGSSLDPAIRASDAGSFLIAGAVIYLTVLITNFRARANHIADDIVAHEPDIVGLQEVSKWTRTGPAPPGADFLDILLADLAERGADYSVAAVSDNAHIGPVPLLICATLLGCEATLDDRDVILVNNDRADLDVVDSGNGNYVAQRFIDSPVGPVSFNRGWAYVDAELNDEPFRLVNTHLETEASPDIQEDQGQEFLAGPADTEGVVIATGDFNSAADGSTTTTYSDITGAAFSDSWSVNPGEDGFTCCQDGVLWNRYSRLKTRIDFVFTRGAATALDADVIGAERLKGLFPPLWPSDHAGVVSTIRLDDAS